MPKCDSKILQLVRQNVCIACGKSNSNCEKTGEPVVEAHHVQEKGMGGGNGGDDWFNLIPLCTDCHTQSAWSWHRNRPVFFKKFPHVWRWLRIVGWKYVKSGELIKLYHPAYVEAKAKEEPVWAIKVEDIYPFIKFSPKQM